MHVTNILVFEVLSLFLLHNQVYLKVGIFKDDGKHICFRGVVLLLVESWIRAKYQDVEDLLSFSLSSGVQWSNFPQYKCLVLQHMTSKHTNRFNRQYSINSLLCLCWWLFKTLVETSFTYLEVAVLIMWVKVFAQIKVQKSGRCLEYKVRNLIENGLHVNGINVYV